MSTVKNKMTKGANGGKGTKKRGGRHGKSPVRNPKTRTAAEAKDDNKITKVITHVSAIATFAITATYGTAAASATACFAIAGHALAHMSVDSAQRNYRSMNAHMKVCMFFGALGMIISVCMLLNSTNLVGELGSWMRAPVSTCPKGQQLMCEMGHDLGDKKFEDLYRVDP